MTFLSKVAREAPHSGKEKVGAMTPVEGESVGGGVRSLSDFYGVNFYSGRVINRRKPFKRFDVREKCEISLAKDLRENTKARLVSNLSARRFSEKAWIWTLPPIIPAAGSSSDNLIQKLSSLEKAGVGGRGEDVVDRKNVDAELNVVESEEAPIQNERSIEDLEQLQNFLENPSISHLKIEGWLCSKEWLLKWALRSQFAPMEKSLHDIAIQTDGEIETVLPAPEIRDKQKDSRALVPQRTSRNCAPSAPSGTNPNAAAFVPNAHSNAVHPVQRLSAYDKALQWKPRTPKQAEAFEQMKKDIHGLLVVTKGVNMKGIYSTFCYATGKPLDLEKVGIPNLKTLLVQMKDVILLKRPRYANTIYIYANLKNLSQFPPLATDLKKKSIQFVPHINSDTLVNVDLRELFVPAPPPPRQKTFYGSPWNCVTDPSYFFEYFNPYVQQHYFHRYYPHN